MTKRNFNEAFNNDKNNKRFVTNDKDINKVANEVILSNKFCKFCADMKKVKECNGRALWIKGNKIHETIEHLCKNCGVKGEHGFNECPNKKCDTCKSNNHNTEQCKCNCCQMCPSDHKTRQCKKLICENCGKLGHWTNECKKTK